MKDKKVLIAHSSSDLYGASKIILQVAELLLNNGYEVVFVLSEKGPLVVELQKLNVQVEILSLGVFRKKYLTPLGLVNRFYTLTKAIFGLVKMMRNHQIDLVYTNTSVVWASGFAAKLTGRKHIWHIHEIPFGNQAYIKLSQKVISRFGTKVIAVSNSVKDFWYSHLKPSQMVTIYNGVNSIPETSETQVKSLPLSENDVVITNISRLIPYKGHLYFVEVANELLKRIPDLKFLIVGSFPPGYEEYAASIKEKIQTLGLESSILLLGQRPDIKAILERSQVLYHSTIEPDPLPTVIFEAQLAGTATVANNLGGPTEIIVQNETGLLVSYENPVEAAADIADLLNDRERMNAYVERAKKRLCKEFSEEEFNQRILALINDVLGN